MQEIIDALNDLLARELAAHSAYLMFSCQCDDWGYERLEKKWKEEAAEEQEHAADLMERILFLEGRVKAKTLFLTSNTETVEDQLTNSLTNESAICDSLKEYITLAAGHRDYGTEDLLKKILIAEEEHLDWIHAQFDQIKDCGEAGYLAQQIRE